MLFLFQAYGLLKSWTLPKIAAAYMVIFSREYWNGRAGQSWLIIEFVNRNRRALSAPSSGACYSRSCIQRRKRVRWSGKWFKTVSRPPATLPPSLSRLPSTLVSLPAPLCLIPSAMHRPQRAREAAGGCFVAAAGFSLRFAWGMFPSLVNISVHSRLCSHPLRPSLASLQPSASFSREP